VKLTLTCDAGAAGSAVFNLTANAASSQLTVACGQSATVDNPLWTANTIATIETVSVPKGTYVKFLVPHLVLATSVAAYSTSLAPCPTGRVRVAACPAPPQSALEQFLFGSPLRAILIFTFVPLIVAWIVLVPFEFWIIRGWIRYFSRKQDPYEVIADLSARPGLGWWVRRYVAWVQMKHRLFRAPLPPGFDDTTGSDRAA
jgi:hypothetical protein